LAGLSNAGDNFVPAKWLRGARSLNDVKQSGLLGSKASAAFGAFATTADL